MVRQQPTVIHCLITDASGHHKIGARVWNAEHAERWCKEAAGIAKACGHMVEPVAMHYEPLHGDEHGDVITRSVHCLHADIVRNANGRADVRALYHFPEKDADDTSAPHPQNPLLTKKQWVKIPAIAARKITVRRD